MLRPMHVPLAALVALCLVREIVQPDAARADEVLELPSPDVPGSHEAFHKSTLAARSERYRELLGVYDAWLAANPSSVQAALERCKFILIERENALESLTETTEDAEEPGDGLEPDCVGEVARRFPAVPAVLQFQLEQLWGDEAIAFGVATWRREDVAWTQHSSAAFAQQLAYHYFWQSKLDQAVVQANHARTQDPAADVGLILATHFKRSGLRARAIEQLAGNAPPTYAHQKLALLIELEAFDEALALIEASVNQGERMPPLLHARALEGVGKTDAARKKYDELSNQQWNRRVVLRRLFYLDLARGDRAKAIAAYAALRDEGYEADPLLRHRLALLAEFPTAPWSARDLLGLLGILGLGLLMAVLPALIVLPVHYVGLLRGAAAGPTTPAGDRWSLKHLWAIATLFLCVDTLSLYLWAYDELHTSLFALQESQSGSLDVARGGVLSILGGAAAVLSWLRRDDFRRWIRGSWGLRRTLGAVLGGLFLFYLMAAVGVAVMRAAGLSAAASSVGVGTGLTTIEVVRSIDDAYGPWVLVPLVAVLVPIYEEVAFRGVFLSSVGRYLPFGWANALQAATFALAHDQLELHPAHFGLGLVAGQLTRRSGGLLPAVALHAAVNLIAVIGIHAGRSTAPRTHEQTTPAARAAELEQRCGAGDMTACFRLGWSYHAGQGVPKDDAVAAGLLRKACDAGIGASCGTLGYLHLEGRGVAKDPLLAVQLFKRACDDGIAEHCGSLAFVYHRGVGVAKDETAASGWFKKACEGGLVAACNDLGRLHQLGHGVEKNVPAAMRLYQRACDGGDAVGCANLSHLYYDGGDGSVPRNLALAIQLAQRACEGRRAESCVDLARQHYFGEGVPRDLAQAARWLRVACDAGEPSGCGRLSGMYQRGEGVQQDLAVAKQLLDKACAAGFQAPECRDQ